jgi:alpha-mannosidase
MLKVESAWTCNALEENQQPLPVSPHGFSVSVKPFQIVTVRMKGAAAP